VLGLAFIISKICRSPKLCSSQSVATPLVKILFWFVTKSGISDTKTSNRAREWALGELGILIGRDKRDKFIPHAKHLGFQQDAPNQVLREFQTQPSTSEDKECLTDCWETDNIEPIENFVLKSLEIFANAQESEEDSNQALIKWLKTSKDFNCFLSCPPLSHAAFTLTEHLKETFKESNLRVDSFQTIFFNTLRIELDKVSDKERPSLEFYPDIVRTVYSKVE
jgi:hypothetical protein